jgi:XTP/dITP diphosphohydrolase
MWATRHGVPLWVASWYYRCHLEARFLDLLLSTKNPGKIEELRSLLSGVEALRLHTPMELGLELAVVEDGADYKANAALKARQYAQTSGMASLADDSGLEVEALNGAPGLFSARYAPKKGATDADRRAYLLQQLKGKERPWPARFRSTVCVALPDGRTYIAEGECEGEIVPEERGTNGFGYDAIFQVAGGEKTMAELAMAEKNQLSHRARAIAKIKERLGALAGEEKDRKR